MPLPTAPATASAGDAGDSPLGYAQHTSETLRSPMQLLNWKVQRVEGEFSQSIPLQSATVAASMASRQIALAHAGAESRLPWPALREYGKQCAPVAQHSRDVRSR